MYSEKNKKKINNNLFLNTILYQYERSLKVYSRLINKASIFQLTNRIFI